MAVFLPRRWYRQPTLPYSLDRNHPSITGIVYASTRTLALSSVAAGSITSRILGSETEEYFNGSSYKTLNNSAIGQTTRGAVLVRYQTNSSSPTGLPYGMVLAATVKSNSTKGWLLRFLESSGIINFSVNANAGGASDADINIGVAANNGVIHNTLCAWNLSAGGSIAIWHDGVKKSATTHPNLVTPEEGVKLGAYAGTFFGKYTGGISTAVFWNRFPTDDEGCRLTSNPFALFTPLRQRIFVDYGAGAQQGRSPAVIVSDAVNRAANW